MGFFKLRNNSILLFFLGIFILTGFQNSFALAPDTLWQENWEGNWATDWHVDAGTWEIGIPTSGPDSVYEGQTCAATVLNGKYAEGIRTRLIRHTYFTVPQENQNPYLRFYHWLNYNYDDYFQLQIKEENGEWEPLSPQYVHNTGSNVWSVSSAYLYEYAGKKVQVGFYVYTKNHSGGGTDVSYGSYIDKIALVYGSGFRYSENWESNVGGWGADGGSWEYGVPSAGTKNSHSGSKCIGTNLSGNYSEPAKSRFVSLPFIVPSINRNPALTFWHWFDFNLEDYGQVQIKEYNSDAWVDLPDGHYNGSSSDTWSITYFPLTAYAGQKIQIGFYFSASNHNGGTNDVGYGWYIDDIEISGHENQSPTMESPLADTTFSEDSGSHLISNDLNTVFSDPDGDDLTFGASSGNPDIHPSIRNDSLFVTASENYFGSGNVFVAATDPGGLSAKDTFLVEITPVNDAPGVFELLHPADKDTVDALGTPIQFVWSQAQNVDEDTIWYDLKIFNATNDTTVADLTGTTFAFNGENILQYDETYQWTVIAMDRFESTYADTFLFYTPKATAVQNFSEKIPRRFTLSQNYSNPFNPSTTIKYALPKASKVKLEVFNLLGQNIATLVNGRKKAGYHQVNYNGSNLPSGVYIYRLSTNSGFYQTKKMVLLR